MDTNEKIVNAKIKFTYLGFNERDELIIRLGFECEGAKTFTTEPIQFFRLVKILEVLDLRNWEKLPCKFARIKLDGARVIALGDLIEDKWFYVKEN